MNRCLIVVLAIILALGSVPLFSDVSRGDASRGIETYVEGLDPNLKVGKQYLVIIGINEYQHWLPLHSPVQDVQEIRDILLARYYIDEVHELYDAQATKANIIKMFVDLQKKVKIDDSVLILYSGHGHLDKNSSTGFWIPVNAGTDVYEQHNWLPHTQLKGLIANIEASHIFVISDSCFAGDLIHSTRSIPPTIDEQYFKRAYSRVSRQVLTSGATETVPDNSDFARQLKSILKRNDNRLLDTLMVYNEVRLGVGSSIPLLGALEGTGHQEGASFLLFLREEVQADPTPFGPIHIETGPSLAEDVGKQRGFVTTGLMAGMLYPLMLPHSALGGSLMMRSQLHYNVNVNWGTVGMGLITGISSHVTVKDEIDYNDNYEMRSIPIAFNVRYATFSMSPWFWSVDLSSGCTINIISLLDSYHEPYDTFVATKLFFSPTLNIGRRLFDRWRASVYASYVIILFDTNSFYGIEPGLKVEYSF